MKYDITTDLDIELLMEDALVCIRKLKMPANDKMDLAAFFLLFVIEFIEYSPNTGKQNKAIRDMYIYAISTKVDFYKTIDT